MPTVMAAYQLPSFHLLMGPSLFPLFLAIIVTSLNFHLYFTMLQDHPKSRIRCADSSLTDPVHWKINSQLAN